MVLIFASGVFAGVALALALVLPALKGAIREVNTIRRVKCWQVDFEGNSL